MNNNSYKSLYGITNVNADSVSTQTLQINSNPLGIANHLYTFPDIDDTIVTETKAQNITNKIINSSSIGSIIPSTGIFTSLSSTGIGNMYRLQINGVEVILVNLFDKTTDTTDNITEGTNKFDHITATSPIVRTGNILSCIQSSISTNGYITAANFIAWQAKDEVCTYSNPLIRTGNNIACQYATTSLPGIITSANWNTFNGKDDVCTYTSPLVRTTNNIACGYASASTNGIITAAQYNAFTAVSTLWTIISGYNTNSASYHVNLLNNMYVSSNIFVDSGRNVTCSALSSGEITCSTLTGTGTISTPGNIGCSATLSGNIVIAGNYIDASGYINTGNVYKVNNTRIVDNLRYAFFEFLSIGGYTAIDTNRYLWGQALYIQSTMVIDTGRNILNIPTITTTNYVDTPNLYISGYQVIDSSRNITAVTSTTTGATNATSFYVTGSGILSDSGRNVSVNNLKMTSIARIVDDSTGYELFKSTPSSMDLMIGTFSTYNNNVGANNISMGPYSMLQYRYGYVSARNIAIGTYSMYYVDHSTNDNVSIGYQAGHRAASSYNNVNIGSNTLSYNGSNDNVLIGHNAMNLCTSAFNSSVLIGSNAGFSSASMSNVVGIGYQSLKNNLTAGNVAIGFQALALNINGENTAVGFQALASNTTGSTSTALGTKAGLNSNANDNTYIGCQAGLPITTGSQNTYVGSYCGYSTQAGSVGVTAIGYFCGNNSTVNYYSCNMGYSAGSTSGDYSTAIGSWSSTGQSAVALGMYATANSINSTSLGFSATSVNDPVAYGLYFNPNVPTITGSYYYVGFNSSTGRMGPIPSARRFKKNIVNYDGDSLDIISKLQPVFYNNNTDPPGEIPHKHIGLIAEDVLPICREVVMVNQKTNECMTVLYDRLVPVLVDAIKKQQLQIEDLQRQNAIMNQKINKLCNLFNIV